MPKTVRDIIFEMDIDNEMDDEEAEDEIDNSESDENKRGSDVMKTK